MAAQELEPAPPSEATDAASEPPDVAPALPDLPSAAPDLDTMRPRLRGLGRGVGELRAGAGQSYLRLMALSERLFGNTDSGRLTVVHENGVGPFYRLIEVTYSIDGEAVYHERDESGALGQGALEIHDGVLSPGEHQLAVVLRYVGDGGPVVTYVGGYNFRVSSSHSFLVSPGRRVALRLRTFTQGPEVPYEDRLGLSMQRTVSELSAER